MTDIILIGCVKTKVKREHRQAQDLYTSPLFAKRKAYAIASGKPWFIVSASYGLVPPNRVIAPYDVTLTDLDAVQTREWALRVAFDLYRRVGSPCNQIVEVHAGAAYTDPLRRPLAAAAFTMVTPLKGLAIGEQLAWYGRPL